MSGISLNHEFVNSKLLTFVWIVDQMPVIQFVTRGRLCYPVGEVISRWKRIAQMHGSVPLTRRSNLPMRR